MSKLDPREVRERTIPILHDKNSNDDLGEITKISPKKINQLFNTYNYVNADSVQKLTRREFDRPVISLYLTLSGEETLRNDKFYLSSFNSMLRDELDSKKAHLDKLNNEDQQRLRQDIKEVQALLINLNDVIDSKMKSIVVFKSGEELSFILNLLKPIPQDDLLVINNSLYTIPLNEILNEENKILLVHVSKDITEFYEYRMGRISFLDKMDYPSGYKRVNVKAERAAGKGQAYFKTQLHNFYKDVTTTMDQYLRRYEAFILAGDESVLREFNEYLPKSLHNNYLGNIYLDPGSTVLELRDEIENLVAEKEYEREKSTLASLEEAVGQGRAVTGIGNVVKVQNRFLNTDLYVDLVYKVEGYMCPDHDYLSVEMKKCRICGKDLIKVPNIMDEVIRIAQSHGANVHIISRHEGALDKYENIAAVVYDSVSKNLHRVF